MLKIIIDSHTEGHQYYKGNWGRWQNLDANLSSSIYLFMRTWESFTSLSCSFFIGMIELIIDFPPG